MSYRNRHAQVGITQNTELDHVSTDAFRGSEREELRTQAYRTHGRRGRRKAERRHGPRNQPIGMPHELAAIIAAGDVEKNGGIARRQRMSRRLRSIGYIVWKLSLPRSGAKPERSIGAPAGCALSCGRHVLYALFNQTSCLYDGHNLRWIIRTN